jgi:tetratricopeptide (TPR) repeat protein
MTQDKLRTLLDEWDEQVARCGGQTPEQFCENRGCVDLLPEFRRILSRLHEVGAVLEATEDAPPTPEDLVSKIEAGRFRPRAFHAAGGLGVVFAAEDSELGRTVALKCMKDWENPDPGSRRRFLLEAEVTARLEHPGIVPVYGMGQDAKGRPFYAMRLIGGETLSDAISRLHAARPAKANDPKWNLEFRRLLQNFIAVCQTVAYAHSRGIIHRDIKPANIMLGTFGETLLLDWGLAKRTESQEDEQQSGEAIIRNYLGMGPDRTLQQVALGTPRYMSPEQAAGEWDRVGPASDIYSLGASLYVLLSGQPVYEGGRETVLDKARGGQLRPPRELNPRVPPALEAICLKAMASQPNDRYATARELANDVERWLADEPVEAYPEPWRVRARRWISRHRTLMTGVAASLLVAIAALAVGLTQLAAANSREYRLRLEANSERDEAVHQRQLAAANEAKALAVLDFFQKRVLAAARPEDQDGGLGRQATIRDAVNAALPHLHSAFASQPTVEAAIRQTLGDTYNYLGDLDKSIEQLELALSIDRSALGADHPDTLRVAYSLALAHYFAGHLNDAITLYVPTLEQMRQKLAADDEDLLNALNGLALAYTATGKPALAIPLHEQAINLLQAKYGADNLKTLSAMDDLGTACRVAGRINDAISIQERGLGLFKSKVGMEHPDTLIAMSNLANSYDCAERFADAIEILKIAVPAMRKKLGPDHPETTRAMNSLGRLSSGWGNIDEAMTLLEQSLQSDRARFGPYSPLYTLRCQSNLARAYRYIGRSADAVTLLEEVLREDKRQLGPQDHDTLRATADLARAYMALNQLDRAEKLLQEALTQAPPGASPSSTFIDEIQSTLGECLLLEGRPADAERVLRARLGASPEQTARDWPAFDACSLLGQAFLDQKKYSEAEPLLLAGYAGMKDRQAKIPIPERQRLTESMMRLQKLYTAWGKEHEAAEWRQKLEVAKKSK